MIVMCLMNFNGLYGLFIYMFLVFRKNKNHQNDAGEAQDPSRKMRQKSCFIQHLELLNSDLYGASYGNFTETIAAISVKKLLSKV